MSARLSRVVLINVALAVCLLGIGGISSADPTPEGEYKDQIKVRGTVQPLGNNPFGEAIGLYNGALNFKQTDVSLSGTGLPITIVRTFTAGEYSADSSAQISTDELGQSLPTGAFGDWDLALPRITTLVSTSGPGTPLLWASTSRCSQIAPQPTPSGYTGSSPMNVEDWWNGYDLVTPEGDHQQLLLRGANNPLSPTMTGTGLPSSYPIVTNKHWMIGCLSQTSNGEPGEAFFAVSPSGTKYWFDRLVYEPYPSFKRAKHLIDDGTIPVTGGRFWKLPRGKASMLVTRMEDRFGNSLSFTYDGPRLTGITSSDGRQVSLQWALLNIPVPNTERRVITQVTVQPQLGAAARTYLYDYPTYVVNAPPSAEKFPSLSSVTLPDGKQWTINLRLLFGLNYTYDYIPEEGESLNFCNINDPFIGAGATTTASITHPSGLLGEFTVAAMKHGRSYVPKMCRSAGLGGTFSVSPAVYSSPTVTQRRLYANGQTYQWTYQYSLHNGSYIGDCTPCTTSVWTKVIEPDNTSATYTFSNQWGVADGQQLQVQIADSVGTIQRTMSQSYAASNAGPYPTQLGTLFQTRLNTDQLTMLSPLNFRSISELGDTYSWQALAFNRYGSVTQTKRFNSIAGQTPIQELVTYANDDAAFQSRWVLGQVKQVDTQLPTAKTVSQTVFNASALPQDRYAFGLKVMSYTWNAQGQLATFKDGLNRTTTLANYTLGIPQLITFADTKTQSIGVSTFGEVSGITDENGATTNYQYDSLSRLRQTDYPAADVVTWTPTINEYFVGGANVLRSTTGRKRTTSTLDSFWRPSLTEEMDTTTGIAMYSLKGYDYSGRVTFESYPSTNNAETAGINSTYDALGRLFRRTTVDGVLLEQIDYLSGNRKQVTDADGRITTITYQAFDSPSYSNPLQIIAPESRTTVYLLDVYGKPLSATQSGAWSGGSVSATRSWFYDTNQRLCRMTEPETASTIYGYDAASQVTWELKGQSGTACVTTKPSTATSFTYDTRGRKTKDDYTGTADDVTYTYDFAGNLKTVVNPNATWTYTYNKRNFIETEQAVVGTKTFVIDPLYDTLGNLTQKTLPDGTVISYAPDAWGRSTQVGTYAIGVQYYPTGLVSSYTLGNGMTYSQSLDSRLRPYVQETTRAGVPFQRFVYGYTPAGDINSVSEAVDSVDTATFTYDGLHRVSTANGLWGAYTYAYDPLDNIRSRSGPSALTYTYNSTSNRLTNVAGGATRTYSYNANGEITGDGTRTFTLNTLGQVKQIGSIATYAFDGNGKRIKTTKGSVSEYALYERSGALVYSEVGTTKTSFVGLAGRALVELKNVSGTITPTYLHPDWLGSPRKASNASGNVLWNESFDPFGNKMNGVSEKVGYTGHASDSESGLTYAQARYYDPVVGRFLSPDPIRQLVDFNLYAYVGNDPVNRTDPTGMQEKLSTVREHAECGAAFCDFTWYGEGGDTTTSEPTTGKAPALNTGYAAWDGDKWVETSEPGVEQVCPECYVLMPGAPLKGALALRSAAAATKGLAPLAEVLNTIGARGFSGVFDTVTGRILIKPSTYEAVPAGWVSARGGHAAVSQLLGGSAAAHRGFAIILQENGTLAVSWLSRTLNPGNGYVAPELRAGIVKAIEAATGRTVSAL